MSENIKSVLKKLAVYETKLGAIKTESDNLTQKILETVAKLKEADVTEYLRNTDISELSEYKKGIRISALTEGGCRDVYSVLKLGKTGLQRISGIGTQGSNDIMTAARQVYNAAQKNISLKLTPDEFKKSGLVPLLYSYRKLFSCGQKAGSLYDELKAVTDANATLVKTGFGRLFASKDSKLKSDAAIAVLTEFYESEFTSEAEACIKSKKKILISGQSAALKDFDSRPADYFALLDSIAGEDFNTGNETEIDEELLKTIENVEVDTSLLNCTLRKYQYFGVQFILNMKNVLLGDEMGLGKTIEAIAVLASLAAEGETHFIVVCPAAVLTNWCREITQHSKLSAYKLHSDELDDNFEAWISNGGVAVTTYEMTGRLTLPEDLGISMLVVDEAHYIKNPQTNRTKAVLALKKRTGRALFMTGTPLENRLDEMQFLISCLQPDIAKKITGLSSVTGTDGFRKKVAPVYLRRKREDVLKELPELIVSEEWCTMNKTEKQTYAESVEEGNFMAMRQVSFNISDFSQGSKYQRLSAIIENAWEQNRKVIVFSFFLNTISKISKLATDDWFGPIDGSMNPENRQKTVDEFSAHEGFAVLLSQIQAGGTGLNIQAASVIVICEPQIKPSIENQAVARAYRMGQMNSVLVYRLLCEDSLDGRIISILKEKQKLFDNYADESVSGDETLKQAQQAEIIEAEKQRLSAEKSA